MTAALVFLWFPDESGDLDSISFSPLSFKSINFDVFLEKQNLFTVNAMKDVSSLVWTPELIGRFWDDYAADESLSHLYFSRVFANNLLAFFELAGIEGEILDMGCGPGYLANRLCKSGYSTSGLEFSEESVSKANEMNASLPSWKGCTWTRAFPSLYADEQFDCVVSIENYEHLLEEWIVPYLNEANRVLKKAGRIFISTPFQENLDAETVYCPSCRLKFHRWQHLRTTSASQLSGLVERYGFRTIYCRGIHLSNVPFDLPRKQLMDVSGNHIGYLCKSNFARILDRLRPRKFPFQRLLNWIPAGPHLMLVAERSA
jgi:2-polyprenyl-3-methyl-5-hydroxy-6-metoxy-1,4-benzoquinol methylase